MDRLVETTLRHNLVPPVVMEFPGITAGGGFSGTSGESSTFRYGFFNETVIEAEIILGNGDIVRASRDEREDLFRAAGGALGTLGIVTLMKLRLVEAKQFVYTRYTRLNSVSEALESIQRTKDDPDVDYLDSMLFSKQHAVVISGQLTNNLPADAEVQTFSDAADPWFYMHVQEQTNSIAPGSVIEEYIPLAEYLFRYDRGAFWVGEQGYTYFKYIPFNSFFRWLLDDFSHTRTLYHALHCTGVSSQFVVQDVAVVYRNAEKMIDFISAELNIWPIWLCPLAPARVPSFHPVLHGVDLGTNSGSLSEPMLNIGIYGWGPSDADEFITKNRAVEKTLSELGGRKWLYAHTFYTEREFWDVYDRAWYESLRLKYHATSLPSVYDKVKPVRKEGKHWTQKVAEMWPIGGLYGMCRAITSGDYRLHRGAKWKW
ncbi:galactose-1-phosphate uridylyltransferase [Pochonia chlamydosporia 170]|uniref:Galactose-1-phosphate uridylyltransferase n=1 Tax=Pochonia chlamydosporia 170 TaxID=1380566 RepID=A0A179FNS5_METCM|nr:galactose-1-phosphate uridylyltransferase [Pochonia chlamydosporia 170]OAQ67234.1 galactose-1-phosphate uridylyltransferase [Pochonia chlamydosporia 170]